ncbi:uncharacterized protein V1518DRAFT_416734 [Limtongia smithiae]|uniref:uncharacterized protein n=1 Tax=Limtongia smithiae TaxID=1125753 RepID=UPI0034CF71DA
MHLYRMEDESIFLRRTETAESLVTPAQKRSELIEQLVDLYTIQLTDGCRGSVHKVASSGDSKDEGKYDACLNPFCASSPRFRTITGGRKLDYTTARQMAWSLCMAKGKDTLCRPKTATTKEPRKATHSADSIDEIEESAPIGTRVVAIKQKLLHSTPQRIGIRHRIFDDDFHNMRHKPYEGRLLKELTSIDDLYILRRTAESPENMEFVKMSLVNIFSNADSLRKCFSEGPEMVGILKRLIKDMFPDPNSDELSEVIDGLAIGFRQVIDREVAVFQRGLSVEQSSIMILVYIANFAICQVVWYATGKTEPGEWRNTLFGMLRASPSNGPFLVLFEELIRMLRQNEACFLAAFVDIGERDAQITQSILKIWLKEYIKIHYPAGKKSTCIDVNSSVAGCIILLSYMRKHFWQHERELPEMFSELWLIGDLEWDTITYGLWSCDRPMKMHVLDYATSLFALEFRVDIFRLWCINNMKRDYKENISKKMFSRHVWSLEVRYLRSITRRSVDNDYGDNGRWHDADAEWSGVSYDENFSDDDGGLPGVRGADGSRANSFFAAAKVIQVYCVLDIDRDNVIGSALKDVREAVRQGMIDMPVKVRFGVGEDGVDQGGVQTELFGVVGRQLCDPAYGLFKIDERSQLAWFWPGYFDSIERYEIAGTLVALAVYNGCTISVQFPLMMYMLLIGTHPTRIWHIEDMFPALAEGLRSVLNYDGDVADLGLTFEYTYETMDGLKTVPMSVPGISSASQAVTNENKHEYVYKYVQLAAYEFITPFFEAFRRGWRRLIPDRVTTLFTSNELMTLVQGSEPGDINVQELKQIARYSDDSEMQYFFDHPVITWFWEIVAEMSAEEKRKLLMFVTSSDRIPMVGGLAGITFEIMRNGGDSERLPTAMTCFGRLMLPEYSSKEKLREKLMMAIPNTTGFGLL